MKIVLYIFLFFTSFIGFGQLEFMEKEMLLFVGVDSIENKKIISSAYVFPQENNKLKLQIDVLHQWKTVEEFDIELSIEQASVEDDIYNLFTQSDTVPAYRFYNEKGYEVLIAKEKHISYFLKGSSEKRHSYFMSLLKISYPKEENHFVGRLPIMHNK